MSIYALKPKFQALLRPITQKLYNWGITANQVTVFACVMSIILGLGLYVSGQPSVYFGLIPFWMLVRMALNAIDGMLAREFHQKSRLGAYLNEITDVISDAALYLPFMWIAPLSAMQIALVIWLSALSELVGILGQVVGKSRRYDGPMGKSDRAFVFGVLGLCVAIFGQLSGSFVYELMWVVVSLITWTTVRRVRMGLSEI